MEKTFTQICELFDQFSKSLELEKLLKQFRKESLEASK